MTDRSAFHPTGPLKRDADGRLILESPTGLRLKDCDGLSAFLSGARSRVVLLGKDAFERKAVAEFDAWCEALDAIDHAAASIYRARQCK